MTAPPRRYSGTWSNIPPSKSCWTSTGTPWWGGRHGIQGRHPDRRGGHRPGHAGAGLQRGGEHPNWMQNLSLACRIQESMNTLYPTLARPMTMRSSRYNQQLSNGSLLVEVGTHGNTLQEALAGARLFARAAGQVLLGLKE
ncbi:stage II sporulation protein P [Flavonifractor plautii]|nr:stage II sporulation protein P [Flavonifractor plautii]